MKSSVKSQLKYNYPWDLVPKTLLCISARVMQSAGKFSCLTVWVISGAQICLNCSSFPTCLNTNLLCCIWNSCNLNNYDEGTRLLARIIRIHLPEKTLTSLMFWKLTKISPQFLVKQKFSFFLHAAHISALLASFLRRHYQPVINTIFLVLKNPCENTLRPPLASGIIWPSACCL